MPLPRRIRTIYTKELVELLRDRRTLIAMVVVPIVLYPLLIIGSVHLLSVQDGIRKIEIVDIAIPDDHADIELQETGPFIKWAIDRASRHFRELARQAESDPELDDDVRSAERMRVTAVPDVSEAVASGACLVGVEVRAEGPDENDLGRILITVYHDKAEIRSETALGRLMQIVDVVRDARQRHLIEVLNVPEVVLDPVQVESINVATPKKVGGMVLGTIVPLVLVLMTITGAIYPAIDLTAGERERGTLETLIACPVPPMQLITGKYLVVTTVALLGAALNLASVGATLYFGGFTEMIGSRGETELPLGVLPIILLALIPFALLFSAVMVAVCSYARTFKEAQNYIMPVIIAALIPGGVAALPGTEFAGINTVVPVMNMVLMARELLLGNYQWGAIALVLLSTTLYAGAAVIIASRVFSTEAVVFADSASLRTMLHRRLLKPSTAPSVSMALLATAVLFPVWMFVQFSLQPGENETMLKTFKATATYMPLVLVILPALLLAYFKVDVTRAFALRLPSPRYLLAALLIGVAAWVPAHELFLLQGKLIPIPKAVLQGNAQLIEAFEGHGLWLALLLIAIVPALCEELFFRGFLFGGLQSSARKWTTIIVTACIFAVFHIVLIKFALTATLGIVLGYLRWQARSIWPSILAHLLHNGSAVILTFWPAYKQALGVADRNELDHLPGWLIAVACALAIAGIALCYAKKPDPPAPTP